MSGFEEHPTRFHESMDHCIGTIGIPLDNPVDDVYVPLGEALDDAKIAQVTPHFGGEYTREQHSY